MRNHDKKRQSPYGAAAGGGVAQFAKAELIRKFQRLEGNYDCCASAYVRVCDQVGCLWRNECLATEKTA